MFAFYLVHTRIQICIHIWIQFFFSFLSFSFDKKVVTKQDKFTQQTLYMSFNKEKIQFNGLEYLPELNRELNLREISLFADHSHFVNEYSIDVCLQQL